MCTLVASDPSCDTCMRTTCLTECVACSASPSCISLLNCLNACADDACSQNCVAQNSAGVDPFAALLAQDGCLATSCSAECAGSN